MKTPEHIEQAVATLTATIQEAARTTTTPESTSRQTITIPQEIPDKIREKRKVKAKWQKHRTRENKKHLNKLAKEIKNKIKEHNNNEFTKFIGTLSTHENINYSLWKATKKIRKPIIPVPAIRKADNTWARNNEEQAEELSNRLCNTFTPHIINNSNLKSHTEEDAQTTIITTDKEYTIPKTSAQEIRNIIDKTKNNKAPGIDLINGKILKNLPPKAIRLITVIFNAILRIQYFPKPWKLAQIKMLHKPGKDPHQTASYRPISLLPVFSKILEKIIYDRIKPIIETKKLIPDHQFGFRNKHSTIEQMHRLINEIIIALENKQYYTSPFMDIEKVFDKINHESVLQTIRKQFPKQIHQLIKSYLSSRIFIIKIKDTYSEVKDIKVGIPQGSVLGPILLWRHSTSPNTTTRH